MNVLNQASHSTKIILIVVLALAVPASLWALQGNDPLEDFEEGLKGKAPTRKGAVKQDVVNASPINAPVVGAALPNGFTPQTRLGYTSGDQWEPAIAADRFGHVYMLYSQYEGVPGCASCSNPTQILQISSDHGTTWSSPKIMYPAGAASGGQWDSQIAVDPVDGRTVYASFMQNNKSDIIVAKSTDFGASWTYATADATNSGTDKPILAVRGQNVHVVYNHSQTIWSANSHDGGQTFTEVRINSNGKLGWALAGGGAVTPSGSVFFSWAGYERSGGATGNVNLYVSRSTDGGATWSSRVLEVSASPPQCPEYNCGWAYLGAQMVMTSDASGTVYVMWNSGATPEAPGRIYFSKSTDNGDTWSAKVDVSTAPLGTHHNFPAIAATGSGDVRVAWMDTRVANGGIDRWNVYYRSSANGGSTWSSEVDVSPFASGVPYIFNEGFRFPFGDYYEMDIDENGTAHLIFGEGFDYNAPGSIWYTKGP
ncbi:MAG TPA: sialidase family protein [Kofleriaceae bacterium]|nr:sialidase family protein [Kofleriaceae bacterium]